MIKNLDRKIAIIGAGPSGLAAAEALYEKGYRDITIFERNKRAGGQSYSLNYQTNDGKKLVYDIGSAQPMSSKNLTRLLNKYKLHLGRGPLKDKSRVVIGYSILQKKELINFSKYKFGLPIKYFPLLFLDFIKLSIYLIKYRRLAKPGFYNFKHLKETSVTFKDWVKAKKFKIIEERFILLITGLMTLSNKNNQDKIHAYTAFKFIYQMLGLRVRYINGSYKPVREGFQELWNRVATKLNVRYDAKIKSIKREAKSVIIETKTEVTRFDDLIISCPFDKIEKVIDSTEKETKIFREIIYNPGYRGAFIARGIPTDGVYWYPDTFINNNEAPYIALVIPEAKVSDQTYLFSCVFSHCPEKNNAVNILQKTTEDFYKNNYNAEILEWVKMQYWQDYGCGFEIEHVVNGAYDKIQSMQGENNTYHVGQLIALPSHSSVVEYSYELINNHF